MQIPASFASWWAKFQCQSRKLSINNTVMGHCNKCFSNVVGFQSLLPCITGLLLGCCFMWSQLLEDRHSNNFSCRNSGIPMKAKIFCWIKRTRVIRGVILVCCSPNWWLTQHGLDNWRQWHRLKTSMGLLGVFHQTARLYHRVWIIQGLNLFYRPQIFVWWFVNVSPDRFSGICLYFLICLNLITSATY